MPPELAIACSFAGDPITAQLSLGEHFDTRMVEQAVACRAIL
jgi:hypothetical protein